MTTPRYIVPDLDAAQRFVDRLRALPPEQWEAFARSLDPLRGDDIRTVWKRARRRSLFVGELPVVRELFQFLVVVGELVAELMHPSGPKPDASDEVRRHVADMPPNSRADYEITADLMDLTAQSLPGDRFALETILLASTALRHRPNWRPRLFTEAYAPLEPYVPASTVSDVV